MSDRLHHDEVSIDQDLVRRLLKAQLPHLGGLPLRAASAQGTDNVVFRLGAGLSVRLPRKPSAVGGLMIELEWLPRLAPSLPLAVPVPVASGDPSEEYPFPWTVCTWVSGEPLRPDSGLDVEGAEALAGFVLALESADTCGGPPVKAGERAGPVAAYDTIVGAAIDGVRAATAAGRIEPGLVDERAAAEVWTSAMNAPAWEGPGVWVHRDLLGGNLVVVDGRLTGVLDFGGLAVGDPAGNVMAAFHLLSPEQQPAFRAALGADDATWARARGWALAQGLEALLYYLDTHPGMVAMARRVIAATLSV